MNENKTPIGNGDKNNGRLPKNTQNMLMFVVFLLAVVLVFGIFNNYPSEGASQKITYDQFIDMLENDQVAAVEDAGSTWKITPKDPEEGISTYYTGKMDDDTELLPLMKEKDVEITPYIQNDLWVSIIWNLVIVLVPVLLLWALLGMAMRRMGGGGVMGVGKSKAKVYIEKETGITFKDVAGEEEAKESLVEVVDFLHNPTKYTEIGAKLPKGALLVGPPGTGKTLLAKAVAGEAHVPFFSLAGSDFVEMFVGVGASRVRDLFDEAKKNAPCIVFIDEIDAIGKSRDSRLGGNDEREQTLNQLLAEMDGFESNQACIILAATNRPEVLDQALLRPGRFDRRIIVERPDLKGREDILKVHAKNVKLDESVDLAAVALATSGAVGADLANMINEAAIQAVKNGRKAICQKDLFDAMEVVMMGKEKKNSILSPEERRIASYHEVGHALTTALQKDAEPVQKITIVPRTSGVLGYVLQMPEEEKNMMTQKEMEARLVTYMGGRAAEEIVFDSVTSGASNDIQQATRLARAMVTQYGMSKRFGLMGLEARESLYLENGNVLNCSDETAAQVDGEVMKILKDAYEEAKRLLTENRECLDRISEFLIEKETITGKEFMEIFHKVRDEAADYHQEELIFAE
ncbi:MAG: ATP-dependent zinc metalloprotease FtsH [Eubacteriales bacterium]|nr:ATP-dependent zinc metalloprotease FtsH [Eubacteriales bacterium]